MARPNMRTLPTQKIVSRPVKAKHSLKSKLSEFSSNKAPQSIPQYITRLYPEQPLPVRRAMVAAVERYLRTPNGQRYGVPSPAMLKNPHGLFEGLL